jgi:uncharacterized glyoxalase superfamily protein PhnB
VEVGGTVGTNHAREATSEEIDRYWPRLLRIWAAYEEHCAGSRRRGLFVLEATPNPRRLHPIYHFVAPRIVVSDPAKVVEFLQIVFGASVALEPSRPSKVRIGDSVVMISSIGERSAFPAFLHVHLDDTDEAYRRAIVAGAISIEEPCDTKYGDRRATVDDAFGNHYQIAHRTAAR